MSEQFSHSSGTLGGPGGVGVVETQYVTLAEPPHELELESGQTLGPIQVAYETYGRLNKAKDNVVLVCHALSGDAHVAGTHHADDTTPGWWDVMIGPGKGLDTDRYFVICSNVLGGCKGTTGPASINPATGQPWGLDFPVITVEDMVKVQKLLLDRLGIDQVLCVIGGSLGGMQVLEWMVRYPEMVRSAIPIATTTRLNAQAIAFDAVGRHAILSDVDFQNGRYPPDLGPTGGLAIARMVGHITYLSEKGMHAKFGRGLRTRDDYGYDFESEFSVETYLDHQGQKFVERFDANSYLYITKAMDYFDLARGHGSLAGALSGVKAKALVLSFTSDWLFTPEQSRELTDGLLANGCDVTYCNIQSPYGHDAFLLEPEVLGRVISGFLRNAYDPGEATQSGGDQAYYEVPTVESIFSGRRVDYELIEELIEPGSTVLDVGCGEGGLLQRLTARKGVMGMGVELNQTSICRCIERGLNVIQADVDQGLESFTNSSYDYVILSQTLQTIRRPDLVIRDMLRVGRKAIVSFPNFAHWRARLQIALKGATPVTGYLPFQWYDSPNIRLATIRDFETFCARMGFRILREVPLVHWSSGPVRILPNLRAEEAVFVITGQ